MRIVAMADVHGNIVALDAVLRDLEEQGGADQIWALGDLAALGPAPAAVLARLEALPHARCVRGNTERYVCTGDRPPPSLEQAAADPVLLPTLVEVAGTFAWTQGVVTEAGWLPWLSRLPLELHADLPGGVRALGVHAAPGRDDGLGFRPDVDRDELARRIGSCEADLLLVGHTHRPMDAQVGRTRVVNVGSVSNPVTPDLRACYAVIEASSDGVRVEHRRVGYDRQAVIADLRRLRHPGAAFIIRHMRGTPPATA